jgi:MoaA/NifB/PqqE/SkfB family radical SAM enzyme
MKTSFTENKFNRLFSDFFRKYSPKIYRNIRILNVNFKFSKKYFKKIIFTLDELSLSVKNKKYLDWKKEQYYKLKGNKPDFAFIEINNSCNINCIMCDTKSSTRPKKLMKLDLFEQSVKKLKKDNINIVGLHTIGDPLANPRLPEIFKILKKYKMKTSISTNGLMLEKHLDTILSNFDICPDLRFSIDGATKETYEKIRVGANWEILIKNLELAKKELEPKGFRISTNMTMTKENIGELGKFVVFFRNYFKNPYYNIQLNFMNSLSPSNKYFIENNVIPEHTHSNRFCKYVAHAIPYVLVDGDISMCCRDYDGSLIMDKLKESSILDSFNNKKFTDLQNAHEGQEILSTNYKLCSDCYEVDWRICEIWRKSIELILFYKPNESSEFYQNSFSKLLNTLNKKDVNLDIKRFL